MRWIFTPDKHIRDHGRKICYARGTADTCRDVLHIVRDEGLDAGIRLQELAKYCREGVMYHPAEPLPEHPPYRPKLRAADELEDYWQLTYDLDEELRHAHINGMYDCRILIKKMIEERDGRSEDEILRGIVAFCMVALDIVAAP